MASVMKCTANCGSVPLLVDAKPQRFRHYRRSTTSKAPRKRTFLASMQKHDASHMAEVASITPSSLVAQSTVCGQGLGRVRSCATPASQRLAYTSAPMDFGLDHGNGNNNGSGINNGKRFGGNDDSFGFGGQDAAAAFLHKLLVSAVVAAAALLAGLANPKPAVATSSTVASAVAAGSPAQQQQQGSGKSRTRKSGTDADAPQRGSCAVHVRYNSGATLVVPLSAAAGSPGIKGGRIVHSAVRLTEREQRMLAATLGQNRTRETVSI